MKNVLQVISFTSLFILSLTNVHAASLGYADVVLDYFDSGAGPISGPFGGTVSSHPVSVTTDVVLGNTPEFLSLPTGSFITVGFTDETIIDGVGNDLFINEVGAASETADVFISSNLVDFIFLGTANGGTSTSFDFSSIGYTEAVQAVQIVGLDNFGSSPGFDVVDVQALAGSIGDAPISTTTPSAVPVPAAVWLFGSGLIGLVSFRKKH